MSQNPFAAPESYSSAVDTNSAGGLVLATQGQRFIHFIIDGIIARILSFAAGMLVALAYIASTGNVNLAPQDELKLNLIALPFGLLAVVFYYILMEAVFQRTLGKLVTGTIV
ncbi:MAG TPA: RDD family protein, partial [Planctomycetaceae bacterium]|nr:RDD family protein [Planctomycetaceae bacterium]